LPTDPLMIESVAPRSSTTTASPLGAVALPKPPTAPTDANPVNGHERDTSQTTPPNSDLQYACIFQLPAARDCTLPVNAKDCDCLDAGATMNPLCQGASGYTTTQVAAKGYPGIRELQVLRGLGPQGIVASICPAKIEAGQENVRDYGYRPVIYPVIDRMRAEEHSVCLPDQVRPDAAGQVPCVVFEASNDYSCDCGPPGRPFADPRTVPAELSDRFPCVCAISQLTDRSDTSTSGFYYVDAAGDACRMIRFVGGDWGALPRNGSTVLIECYTDQDAATN
jgi:hypothetical protein